MRRAGEKKIDKETKQADAKADRHPIQVPHADDDSASHWLLGCAVVVRLGRWLRGIVG